MKKVLVRGGYSPFDGGMTPERALAHNLIGGNTGNTVYLNSIFRLLAAQGIEAVPDGYQGERGLFGAEDIARINEEYDAYLVPLADAFRDSFTKQLKAFTRLFKKLTIPCVVVGVCLRTPFEPRPTEPHSFDGVVKDFVAAALERSALVGVRGEVTARYLAHLGFKEDVDFMAIGCPSMFTFGESLQQKPLKLTPESKLSVNFNQYTHEPAMRFLQSLLERYPASQYVPQNGHDLRLAYLGVPVDPVATPLYPATLEHPLYQRDQIRMYVNPYTWMDSLAACDLSIGGRIHGNIVSVLAGTPAVFMPTDGRTRELCEYHCFPHVAMRNVTEESQLEDLLDRVDLRSHLKMHADRYERFQRFLSTNGLPSECSTERRSGLSRYEVGQGIASISREELVARWVAFNREAVAFKAAKKDARIKKEKTRTQLQKQKVERLQKENEQLKKKLNRKSVRLALGLAGRLPH
ncbi:MAG: polysaccharide pyruvyl transferase family protein [Coriobacteriia bacterium]|nr:polysaccharide pyruvyl transferase family protein [Coriobacteriia bacterium]